RGGTADLRRVRQRQVADRQGLPALFEQPPARRAAVQGSPRAHRAARPRERRGSQTRMKAIESSAPRARLQLVLASLWIALLALSLGGCKSSGDTAGDWQSAEVSAP